MQVTSRNNSLLRLARAVRDGDDTELIYVEGLRLAAEALRSELSIEAVIVSEQLAAKDKALAVVKSLQSITRRSILVSEKLLESVSFTKTPQGIVVLATRPQSGKEKLNAATNPRSLVVVMHELNNPVNVGAVIRTAEAAGAIGVITTRNTNDPFSPKSLRGAMGSAFRLPIWSGLSYQEMIAWCKQKELKSICAAASAATEHTDIDWTGGCALVLGRESSGLTVDEIAAASTAVRIPMAGQVESLNVSVAAGILLFEAARQRRTSK